MFIPFKKFDEVTAIVETAVVGDRGNGESVVQSMVQACSIR